MEKQTIVLYPVPVMGHMISMVELGKLLLNHPSSSSSLTITIIVITPPFNAGSTAPYINHVAETNPSIHFHYIPTLTVPLDSHNSPHHETLGFELLRLSNPLVHQALKTISQTSTIRSLVLDVFCSVALDVANELHLPTFYFYTSGLSDLALYLYFPTLHNNTIKNFKDLRNEYLHVPGVPSILATDMPKPMLDREDKAYECFLNSCISMPKALGILVNSFELLEPRALKAIKEGLCVPNAPTPPIYSIGPLIAGSSNKAHECLTWLDLQPKRSVVFLCFGSLGLFSEEQLTEIAVGLEKSGQRFLWVVRNPPTRTSPEIDLNALLPSGFLDRTKGRGLVLKSWAPQVEVLSHESVGGFVTHCGWNSILEAVCGGVPLIAWPLYAEQRVNRVFLVEEMKIALPIMEDEGGLVSSGEVEKRVRQLMESEEGRVVREEMVRMSEGAKAAMSKGGSSIRALGEFAELWKQS